MFCLATLVIFSTIFTFYRLVSWYNKNVLIQLTDPNNKPLSSEDIHTTVEKNLNIFKNCSTLNHPNAFEKYPCVFDKHFRASETSHTIYKGCYVAFLRHFLRVFPRKQILFIKFEDMVKDITTTAHKIYKHLGLWVPFKEQKKVWGNKTNYTNTVLTSTRQRLDEFYRPFNEDLADLLGSKKWLWSH